MNKEIQNKKEREEYVKKCIMEIPELFMTILEFIQVELRPFAASTCKAWWEKSNPGYAISFFFFIIPFHLTSRRLKIKIFQVQTSLAAKHGYLSMCVGCVFIIFLVLYLLLIKTFYNL